jgi:hypothetical protein
MLLGAPAIQRTWDRRLCRVACLFRLLWSDSAAGVPDQRSGTSVDSRGFAIAGVILGGLGSLWLVLGGFAMLVGMAGMSNVR